MQIGLLYDSVATKEKLLSIANDLGLVVTRELKLAELKNIHDGDQLDRAIPWLVCCDLDSEELDWLDDWLATLDYTLILDLPPTSDAEILGWRRRVSSKLAQLQGMVNLDSEEARVARKVCVIGASTGGPEAVREFFSALPADLGIAWIYVQHIDPGYEATLVNMLNRSGKYPVKVIEHGSVLSENEIVLISGDGRFDLVQAGTFVNKSERWPGRYQPSIDQVVANVASLYGASAQAIFFTGMGDDGVVGARLLKQQGGTVWSQSPITCVASSMPESVISEGVVDYQASPTKMAKKLVSDLSAE